MIELDGAAGGGQLVRTALSLSALTGEPFRMTDVRGGRSNPGLRPQHLAAVSVVADICDADVAGATEGSEELTFEPAGIRAGAYGIDVGTAGSLPLLFDAVLPLAVGLDAPLVVAARGGTDVKWAPTMAYYRRVKLPLVRRNGVVAALDLDRTGFYPVGDGEATLRLAPSAPSPIALLDRGERSGARVYSTASADLADREVAERQASAAVDGLENAGMAVVERSTTYAETASPGSALGIRLDYGGSIAGFDALGERGKPAEDVAADAVGAATVFDVGAAAVDPHMADQVVVLLAIAGGRVRIPEVTDHVETGRRLVDAFDRPVSVEREDGESVLVRSA